MNTIQSLSRRTRWVLVPVAVSVLVGCKTLERVGDDFDRAVAKVGGLVQDPTPGLSLPPAEQPTYRVGQTFVYERDRVRQVRALDDGEVAWGNGQRELFRTRQHFFLPRVLQDNDRRTVRRSFAGDPSALWPLQIGKQVEFVEHRSTFRKASGETSHTERRWRCSVDDARVSRTPAGAFDSYRVTCRSYRQGFSSWRSLQPIQVVYWDYAPAIGHYVRRESWSPRTGKRSVRSLSAALPASLASPRRIDAVLQRLAESPGG
jgi:hypothetical protein